MLPAMLNAGFYLSYRSVIYAIIESLFAGLSGSQHE